MVYILPLMGRSLTEGTSCGSEAPHSSPAAALSPCWSCAVGPAVPAWGPWANDSPQKPKGQPSLACGDRYWGCTGDALQSHLNAAFGRQHSVTLPEVVCRGMPGHVPSVMGGVRTQPGDKEQQGKL